MESIFSLNNLFTLGILTLLQAVLGFDNLLYISLESKRAPEGKRTMVRRYLGVVATWSDMQEQGVGGR